MTVNVRCLPFLSYPFPLHTDFHSFDLPVAVFAAVDQSFADRLAKKLNASPVQPLKAAPAAELVRVKHNIGFKV